MNAWDEPAGSERDRARGRRNASYAAARQLARAVADREQGRRRLNATTMTVSFASVVAAGVVVAVLPGSTHASTSGTSSDKGTSSSSGATTPTPASSSGSGSSNSSDSANSSDSGNSSDSNSGSLQQPVSPPQNSGGGSGGGAVSGGT